jgi:hypothetical protein
LMSCLIPSAEGHEYFRRPPALGPIEFSSLGTQPESAQDVVGEAFQLPDPEASKLTELSQLRAD